MEQEVKRLSSNKKVFNHSSRPVDINGNLVSF